MRITDSSFEITQNQVVQWDEVQAVRYSNERLALLLVGNRTVEVEHISPGMVDKVFRCFEQYRSTDPHPTQHK